MSIEFNINTVLNNYPTYDLFKDFLKVNYYNKIYTKKISDNLCIVYNKFNVQEQNDSLYNECRSIIIEFNDNVRPKIISYTHDNITYLRTTEYVNQENDLFEESFEGTLISVFYNDDKWYFTTSRCGDIDNSYFYNKERTFGMLFDECIVQTFNLETGCNPRYELTKNLNQNLNYYFVLIHHENKNIIDYTERFGYEYKILLHVITRLQTTQEVVNYDIPKLMYPFSFPDAQSASTFLNTNTCTEGVIVKRLNLETNKIFMCKIHSDNYWIEKEKNPNYPNNWLCYLDIYKKDNPEFRISDYQQRKNIVEEIELNGKKIDITGLINLLFKGTGENLYNIINHFTHFNHDTKTYTKINELDYQKLTDYRYQILRKQISILQNLINKNIIRSSTNIITHIKKYISVEDFANLLRSMYYLITETKLITPSNKYYLKYLNLFLERIDY